MTTADDRMGDFFRLMVNGRKCLAEILASTKLDSDTHKAVAELNRAFESFLDVCDAWDYDIDESIILSGRTCVVKQSGEWFSPETWVDGQIPNLDMAGVIIIPEGATVTGVPTNAVTFTTQCEKEKDKQPEQPEEPKEPAPAPLPEPKVEQIALAPAPVIPVAPPPAAPAQTPTPPTPTPPNFAPTLPESTTAVASGLQINLTPSVKKKEKAKEVHSRPRRWARKKIPIGVIARSVSKRRTKRK